MFKKDDKISRKDEKMCKNVTDVTQKMIFGHNSLNKEIQH